jgi:hypothetical protein
VEGSLVKEKEGHICRCTVEHRLDISASIDKKEHVNKNKTQSEKIASTEIIEE